MLIFYILFDEVDKGPRHEKKIFFLTHQLNGTITFLEKCYQWLQLITCSYTCRENVVGKKMAMCKSIKAV